MTYADAYQRLQIAMKAELQRSTGRIREIEAGLGRSEGYLSRFCRGEISIPLEVFLRTIELLGKEPGQFFAKALGANGRVFSYLKALADRGEDPQLERLHKTVCDLRLAAGESLRPLPFFPVVETSAAPKVSQRLDEFFACTGIEQRRRLRSAARHRQLGFVVALLRRLDQQRYEQPREALKLIELVGTEVVPALADASPTQKHAVALYALGIYGSACRTCGDSAPAAYALLVALEEALASSYEALYGELLRRASCVLLINGQFAEALELLGEAMVIFDELDLEIEVGKVQVLRGLMFHHQGNQLGAVKALHKALRRLPEEPELAIYRTAAFQQMALACEATGDFEKSEEWLRHAVKSMDPRSSDQIAKLLWLHGELALRKGELQRAEAPLRQSRELLRPRSDAEFALVSLDLTRLLLAKGQARDALHVASDLAGFLRNARKSRRLESVVLEFVQNAIEGGLSLAMVEKLETELKRSGARRPGALAGT